MERKTQKHRLFNKKAGASVGVAIKVLTSVILGAAMLAGTYGIVKTTVVPTTENKVSSMFEVTDAVELNGGGAGGGVVVPDPVVELKRNGIIPDGAVYTPNGGTALVGNGTNTFPETPATGDTYEEGDYVYTYNRRGSYGSDWSVKVKDTSKTTYGEILSEIIGKPITNMYMTFYNCTSLTTAPAIPNSVTSMYSTFWGCTSLTTAPTIPSSVTNMEYTFKACTSLTTAPVIPSYVKNMRYTFDDCTSLITPPDMSNANSVTSMFCTFVNCASLTTAPTIPNRVTTMYQTFFNCTNLTTAPVIPSYVKDMTCTFDGCTSLTTTPDMSNASSVTNMSSTFRNCTSLTTASTIPNSVTNMSCTFQDCTSLTTAPVIPSYVKDMRYTFSGCTKLTGTIEVNANPTSYSNCLKSTQITGITGSCSQTTKDRLMQTK